MSVFLSVAIPYIRRIRITKTAYKERCGDDGRWWWWACGGGRASVYVGVCRWGRRRRRTRLSLLDAHNRVSTAVERQLVRSAVMGNRLTKSRRHKRTSAAKQVRAAYLSMPCSPWKTTEKNITDHFSGPDRAVGHMCVCLRTLTWTWRSQHLDECKNHAGTVFWTSWPWPFIFWPQSKCFPGLMVERLYVKCGDRSYVGFFCDVVQG